MSAATAKNIENPLLEIIETGGGKVTLEKHLSREEFIALSERFPDLRMEREANGKTNIMSPVKKGSGKRESVVLIFVGMWRYRTGLGQVFSPSTGIEFPDGSVRSPDCAWVSEERLAATASGDDDYLKAIPDFVAEIRSVSDRISKLKKKMTDTWMANGVRLAWLIDPYAEEVHIYREGKPVEVVKGFSGKKLSGEDVMPGMELPLEELKR